MIWLSKLYKRIYLKLCCCIEGHDPVFESNPSGWVYRCQSCDTKITLDSEIEN